MCGKITWSTEVPRGKFYPCLYINLLAACGVDFVLIPRGHNGDFQPCVDSVNTDEVLKTMPNPVAFIGMYK